MNPKQFREAIEKQCTIVPRTDMTFEDAHDYWHKRDAMANAINKVQQGEAVQVCSAGEWPDPPTSFSEWLERNQDSIECCENCTEIDKRLLDNRDNITNSQT